LKAQPFQKHLEEDGRGRSHGSGKTWSKEPILFSKMIQLSSEVKYLGITLDKGLTWKKQLDYAINKAYKAFSTCKGTFGKTWGLKPKVVYWIYTAVVRPIIIYATRVKL
jgi:hypothetical protein